MRIQTRQLTREFGSIRAVDDLSLRIDQRGVVGLLGPNGAGKTTLMRMLIGALPQSSGSAFVAGYDVTLQPLEVKSRVGYLPEQPPLYPELRVGEYLGFVAELRGVPRRDRSTRIGDVLAQVGLTGWENRGIEGLSKGYRQRVGLAQAIVHGPEVLILDEPTSGLDPTQQTEILTLIETLGRDRLVLLSTHALALVAPLCDRVLLLHRGRVVGDGTVQALAEQAGLASWVALQVACEDDLCATLSSSASVHSVRRLSTHDYRLTGTDDLVSALAALATSGDWGLRALHPQSVSLDDVFRALVTE